MASIGFAERQAGRLGARALTWSAGQFVRLMLDLGAGRRARHARATRATATSSARRATTRADRHRAGRSLAGDGLVDGDRARRRPATRSPSARPTRTTTRRLSAHRRRPATTARSASPVPLTGGTTVLNIVATSRPRRAPRARCGPSSSTSRPGTLIFDRRRPGRRRQRARATSPIRRRPTSTPGAYDLQQFQVFDAGDTDHLPRPHARPDADVRQPARRAAGRRLRARPGRRADLDRRRRSRSATTDRVAARGAG